MSEAEKKTKLEKISAELGKKGITHFYYPASLTIFIDNVDKTEELLSNYREEKKEEPAPATKKKNQKEKED